MLVEDTGNRLIAEASPRDNIWGIGLGEKDPRAHDKTKWLGQNLLGEGLMKVRKRLRDGDVHGDDDGQDNNLLLPMDGEDNQAQQSQTEC